MHIVDKCIPSGQAGQNPMWTTIRFLCGICPQYPQVKEMTEHKYNVVHKRVLCFTVYPLLYPQSVLSWVVPSPAVLFSYEHEERSCDLFS